MSCFSCSLLAAWGLLFMKALELRQVTIALFRRLVVDFDRPRKSWKMKADLRMIANSGRR